MEKFEMVPQKKLCLEINENKFLTIMDKKLF